MKLVKVKKKFKKKKSMTGADKETSSFYLRICNMLNAGLIIFAGVYSFVNIGNFVPSHLSLFFVSAYLCCFGCLLCCFEIRIKSVEAYTRENFGFMYTYVGRTIFLIFLATICFGIQSGKEATGLLKCVCFDCFVGCFTH